MEAQMAHFFLLISGLIYATIAKRLDIIKMGPTVAPNFVVVHGKRSLPCPDAHPYAFDTGDKCCSSYLDALNRTRILSIYDSEDHCSQGDTTSCPHLPSGRKCTTPCHPNSQCGIGEGTCHSNYDCAGLLVCGYNEGACDTSSGELGPNDSCCTDSYRCSSFSDMDGCCTESTPCGKGDGDCDAAAECMGDLKCGFDNCEQKTGSFTPGHDCCE